MVESVHFWNFKRQITTALLSRGFNIIISVVIKHDNDNKPVQKPFG